MMIGDLLMALLMTGCVIFTVGGLMVILYSFIKAVRRT